MKRRSVKYLAAMLTGILPFLLLFQNCRQQVQFKSDASSLSTDLLGQKTCFYNGIEYGENSVVQVFQNSAVPFNSTCVGGTRTCIDGEWTGDGVSYLFDSCTPGAPASCSLFGEELKHGQSKRAFQNSSVNYGSGCIDELRTCNNGVLSGSYNFSSCGVGAPNQCLFNGSPVAHGQTVNAFLSSSVPFDNTCISQQRRCTNGNLDGSYEFAACSPGSPLSCSFNGSQVAHGQQITAFETSSVPFDQSCHSQNRVCSNGSLSGNFTSSTCAPNAPLSCQFNGLNVAHGASVTAYLNNAPPSGSLCSSQMRSCNNGALSGTYTFGTCAVQPPASLCAAFDNLNGDMQTTFIKNADGGLLNYGTFSDNYWSGGSEGQVYDKTLTFHVADKQLITQFLLNHVNYDDWMLLKINGHVVYVGPKGGDQLNQEKGRVRFKDGVDGLSEAELGVNWSLNPNTELKDYLVNGTNTIEMRVIVAGLGEGAITINVKGTCP